MEGASMRPEEGGSDDLSSGLLGVPDIHQDDPSGAFETRVGQSTAYVPVLDGNTRCMEEGSIRLGKVASGQPEGQGGTPLPDEAQHGEPHAGVRTKSNQQA